MPVRPDLRALYPPDWPAISRRIRRARARNRCEWRGAANAWFHPETRIVVTLSVARLVHNPANNADDDLAALRQACHNRCDAPKRTANRKRNALCDAGQLTLPLEAPRNPSNCSPLSSLRWRRSPRPAPSAREPALAVLPPWRLAQSIREDDKRCGKSINGTDAATAVRIKRCIDLNPPVEPAETVIAFRAAEGISEVVTRMASDLNDRKIGMSETRSVERFRRTIPVLLLFLAWTCAACAATAEDMAFSEPVPESAPALAAGQSDAAQPAAGGETEMRQTIANANVSLIVADAETALSDIERIATELGGYVADVDVSKGWYGETEALRGSMTLRVPSDSLNDGVDRMQALATDVNYLKINRQDVTDQYSDLDARLRNLRATEAELLALLTEVRQKPNAKVEDILAVHRSLTQIREEIETLQGRKNLLDNQIDFSTIWVELVPDSLFRPIVAEPWSASGPARNALRALVATLQRLLTALIWALLYLTPLLLVILVPLAVLIWLARLWTRRRRKDGA